MSVLYDWRGTLIDSIDNPITVEHVDSELDVDSKIDSEVSLPTRDESSSQRPPSDQKVGVSPVDGGLTRNSAPSAGLDCDVVDEDSDSDAWLFAQSAGGEYCDEIDARLCGETSISVATDQFEQSSNDSKRSLGNRPPSCIWRKRSPSLCLSPSIDTTGERPKAPVFGTASACDKSTKRRRVLSPNTLDSRLNPAEVDKSRRHRSNNDKYSDTIFEAVSHVAPGENDANESGDGAARVGHVDTVNDEVPEPIEPILQPALSSYPSPAPQPYGEGLPEQGEVLDYQGGGRAIDDHNRGRIPSPILPWPDGATFMHADKPTVLQSRQADPKLTESQIRESEHPSPLPERIVVPPANRPYTPSLALGTQPLWTGDQSGSTRKCSYEIKEISLRPLSIGTSFITITLKATGSPLKDSDRDPAKLAEWVLRESGWIRGKVKNALSKLLAQNSHCEVSGFLLTQPCDNFAKPTVGRAPVPGHNIQTDDYRKRAWALYRHAAGTGTDEADTPLPSDIQEDLRLRNQSRRLQGADRCYGDLDSGAEVDEDHEDDRSDEDFEIPKAGSTNRRWQPEEEAKLLAWRRDGRPWQWIFDRFPYRTEAAVRLRCYTLQRSHKDRE
ncbi:MAG: hypothetical protein Q9157_008392 [Trypethelium eluteriae]